MTSQWKMGICGLGVAALVLAGCQKTENAGGAAPAPEAASGSTASTTATSNGAGSPASRPPFGFLDTPKEGATVAAGSWAFGWALDDSGIAQVTVVTEKGATSPVARNQPFPGVAAAYPGFPNAERAGFGFQVPKVEPGIHTLTVTLTAADGGKTEIRRQIRIR
ncbi:MAG: hypothetical protein M3R62_04300 [Acidobacteriota bacterium]|nr:hypothetical protein [Acidobacteriota bacterium]